MKKILVFIACIGLLSSCNSEDDEMLVNKSLNSGSKFITSSMRIYNNIYMYDPLDRDVSVDIKIKSIVFKDINGYAAGVYDGNPYFENHIFETILWNQGASFYPFETELFFNSSELVSLEVTFDHIVDTDDPTTNFL